ncbi:putative signal transduction protein [Desulforapulum autotrophicum HRM2]|uniref:Signal transduction protein n=1 Tax=Desulforapulum autotrophicum (strain ATCC 43914 / DSM 3382 / VKM B-1955 / HRM2) TaxID=177437 RepID=C0QCS4_DESAH|nr:HDOD domain-containing protein [Desulforapulum autotrophicum]ACN15151.1 putative signal transduction protein [Desulforapulum autotrophicum HRM2]
MVEKQLDKILKKNTLYHLGFAQDVPGFNVGIAALSCILLIQKRQKDISISEDSSLSSYTSETLLDELMDMGVAVDCDYDEIIRRIQDEKYIFIDSEDRYSSGKLSIILTHVFSLVYPTMEGMLLIAYLVETAKSVKSIGNNIKKTLTQVDQTLRSQGVSVGMEKMPQGYGPVLNKIVFHPHVAIGNGEIRPSSFATIFRERARKRKRVIVYLENSMKKKGDLPVLPLNGRSMKQQMAQHLYSTSDISDIILSDVAMIINILKKANQGGKKKAIATISHAIMLLGNDELHKTIEAFTSLDDIDDADLRKEFEHFFVTSYMSNSITRHYAMKSEIKDIEQMCICSMIHNLGQMIVLYYYPEAYNQIKKITLQHNNKRRAAREVLGTTYDNIGIYFATEWHLPFTTIESLRVCYFNRIGKTRDNLIINLPFCSGELCAFLGGGLDKRQTMRLRELVNSLNLFSRELSSLLEKAWNDTKAFSKKQKISITKRELAKIAATG